MAKIPSGPWVSLSRGVVAVEAALEDVNASARACGPAVFDSDAAASIPIHGMGVIQFLQDFTLVLRISQTDADDAGDQVQQALINTLSLWISQFMYNLILLACSVLFCHCLGQYRLSVESCRFFIHT